MLNGIINIYKEKGYTSHDVVAKARKILSTKKIGHTGTLDPEAEGVLPLCIGQATKAVQYVTDSDKCYEAEVILGAFTTTEDQTGEIVETFDVNVTKEQVEKVIASFKGSYIQTPPMYSAIKVNGVRLYELARKGIVIERPKREVTIYDCQIIEWYKDNRFRIRVGCSKGTYIRTLCTDIGKKLKCGAYMGELLRTKVGPFTLQDSVSLDTLSSHQVDIPHYLHTLDEIFKGFSKIVIEDSASRLLYNGNKLDFDHISSLPELLQDELIRVYDSQNRFIALYKCDKYNHCLQVEKMFYT